MSSLHNIAGRLRVIRLALLLVVACGVVLLGSMATAQTNGDAAPDGATLKAAGAAPAVTFTPATPFKQLPFDPNLKRDNSRVQAMLRNQQFANEDERKQFENYYKRYYFPLWTTPDNVTFLPGYRNQLGIAFRNGKRGAPYDLLTQIAMQYGGGIARGHFHPAARVNAMLMIGELHEEEANAPGAAPKPKLAAQKILLDTVTDAQQIDAVKVAALVGLNRHARLNGIPMNKVDANSVALPDVVDVMLGVLQSEPAQGRSADGHAWMQAQAAEILGLLKTVGRNGAVPNALGATVARQDTDFSTRCVAAEALGRLHYSGGGVNNKLLADAMTRMIVDACHAEADDFSRRRLKARLSKAWIALSGDDSDSAARGISVVIPRDLIDQIKGPLTGMLQALDDRGLLDADVAAAIDTNVQKLEPLVAVEPAAPATAPAAAPATAPPTTPAPVPPAAVVSP